MAKIKFKLKFSYDAPVSQTFVIISILVYLIDFLALKFKLNATFLLSPTSALGSLPFAFSDVKTWLRIFLYVFGGTDKVFLFTNLLFIILIGPVMEERYGSFVIGIMFLVTTFFTGVLNACFCKNSFSGCSNLVFMLLILNALMFFTKRTLSATSITIIVLFILRQFFIPNANGVLGSVIVLTGGLCGSLLAFISSPKAKAAKKQNKSLLTKAERINQIDKESPRKQKKSNYNEEETTVVGTLKW